MKVVHLLANLALSMAELIYRGRKKVRKVSNVHCDFIHAAAKTDGRPYLHVDEINMFIG
jgi:hypothetical protein